MQKETEEFYPTTGDYVQVLSWGKTPVMTGVLIKIYDKDNFHGNESFEYKVFDVLCHDTGQIKSFDEPYYTVRKID